MVLQNPEKELRFTRSLQAIPFLHAGFLLLTAAIILYVSSWFRSINPALPSSWWALLPFGLGLISLKLCAHMLRHAYIILTPLGVEVLPLIRPRSGMRLIYWHEIHDMDLDDRLTQMTLHFDAAKTGGVHLTLRPIAPAGRELLAHAMRQRLASLRSDAKK